MKNSYAYDLWQNMVDEEGTELDFDYLKTLSSCSSATVYLVYHRLYKKRYVAKFLKKTALGIQIDMERLALNTLRHDFLNKLEFEFETRDDVVFVFEWIQPGDLGMQLEGLLRFKEKQARFIAAEILIGMEYIHSQGFVHRDIKPDNILIRDDGHIVIADLGMATKLDAKHDIVVGHCGTAEYQGELENLFDSIQIAPEVLQGVPYGKSVDFWSFGITIFELVFGFCPFSSQTDSKLRTQILHSSVHFPKKPKASPELRDLILQVSFRNLHVCSSF
jgi:serine/threonine protein kinase